MLPVISFALAAATLVFGALYAVGLLGLRRPLECLVAVLVLTLAGWVAVAFLIGDLCGAFTPLPMAVGIGGLGVLLGALGARFAPDGALGRTVRLLRAGAATALTRLPRRPFVAALALLVGAQYAWQAWLAVRLPGSDWDGLWYHLPAVDTWITSGAIVHAQPSLWLDVYPMNVELVMAIPGLLLHSMRFAALAQFPLFALGALSVAGLARRLGARRGHSAAAGLIALAIPAAFVQASTAYIDASSAALVMAALYLATGTAAAVRLSGRSTRVLWARSILVAAAVGLAIGSKTSALPVLPVLLLVLLLATARFTHLEREPRPQYALEQRAALVAVFGGVLVAAGGFWYLRTWHHYGNPFQPFTVAGFQGQGSVQDIILKGNTPPSLRGLSDVDAVLRSWMANLHPQATTYDVRLGGLGLFWPLLVLPAALLGLLGWFRDGRRGPAITLVAVAVLVLVASPAPWWARYTLTTELACLPLAASALSRALRRRHVGGVRGRFTYPAVATATVAAVAVSMWWATNPTSVASVTSNGFMNVSQALRLTLDPQRAAKTAPWDAYTALNAVPDGATIALPASVALPFLHPIFGQRLQHDVAFVSATTDTASLRQELAGHRARYLLLGPVGGGAAQFDAVQADSQHFRRLNPTGRGVYGEDLFAVGDYAGQCPYANAVLHQSIAYTYGPGSRTAHATASTTAVFRVRIADACDRSLSGATVQLLRAPAEGPLWDGVKLVTTATSAHDGTASINVPLTATPGRYFLHFDGNAAADVGVSAVTVLAAR